VFEKSRCLETGGGFFVCGGLWYFLAAHLNQGARRVSRRKLIY
jgi:hypothetical protein